MKRINPYYSKYHNDLDDLRIAYEDEKESLLNVGITSFDEWIEVIDQSEIESILGR